MMAPARQHILLLKFVQSSLTTTSHSKKRDLFNSCWRGGLFGIVLLVICLKLVCVVFVFPSFVQWPENAGVAEPAVLTGSHSVGR